jgi:hypothetical protein
MIFGQQPLPSGQNPPLHVRALVKVDLARNEREEVRAHRPRQLSKRKGVSPRRERLWRGPVLQLAGSYLVGEGAGIEGVVDEGLKGVPLAMIP